MATSRSFGFGVFLFELLVVAEFMSKGADALLAEHGKFRDGHGGLYERVFAFAGEHGMDAGADQPDDVVCEFISRGGIVQRVDDEGAVLLEGSQQFIAGTCRRWCLLIERVGMSAEGSGIRI